MKTEVHEKETQVRPRAGTESGFSKPDALPEEVRKRVEAAGTPGPAHQALGALVGDWKAEVKCWMDPGEPPQVSQGKAHAGMAFKGRFLEEEFYGEMMGRPFTGRTLLGFDNTKQTFNSVWVSDTQTSLFVSEGKGDHGYKTITLEGRASCAGSGRTDVLMKTVYGVITPDKHILEMFDASKGGNAKTMEITYTRQ